MEKKETNGSKASKVLVALLTEHPDGLVRSEIEELGDPMGLPRNRAGYYIREGVEHHNLNSKDVQIIREDKTYKLKAAPKPAPKIVHG